MLRIWSAACSTGEEPYSIACCLAAAARREPQRFEILATDISTRVLEQARRGIYSASTLASLPPDWVRAGFLRGQGKSDGLFRVRPEVAARIRFERFNLVETTRPHGGWHVIFCRNVMIYFDKPTQERVVARLSEGSWPWRISAWWATPRVSLESCTA